MQVGVFCSSNKPHLWSDLYKTLSDNSVDWNLCIAGPNPPIESLPGNVKYIQTNVKPAQCYFIAAKNVNGEYVMHVSDDLMYSPSTLDNLVKTVGDSKTMASARFDVYKMSDHYNLADFRVPKINGIRKFITLKFPLPIGFMMCRETFFDIGIDKSFIALYWDLEIAFELVSRGGKVIINELSVATEVKNDHKVFMSGLDDRLYLTDMWIEVDKVKDKRKVPIDPLTYTNDVLKISQGKKSPISYKYYSCNKKLKKVVSGWT